MGRQSSASSFWPQSARRRAMTLIELAVAVGIIALVVGILVPVVGRAQESAQQTACANNLRQIAFALLIYANNNGGRYPRPGTSAPRSEDWVYWQANRNHNDGRIVPYLGAASLDQVLVCPSDDPTIHMHVPNGPYPYSYTVNESVCCAAQVAGRKGHAGYHAGAKDTLTTNKILHPEEKILVIDESAATVDDGCWCPQNYDPASADKCRNMLSIRHEKGIEQPTIANTDAARGNAAFCDGHVDFIPRNQSFERRYWDAPWDGISRLTSERQK